MWIVFLADDSHEMQSFLWKLINIAECHLPQCLLSALRFKPLFTYWRNPSGFRLRSLKWSFYSCLFHLYNFFHNRISIPYYLSLCYLCYRSRTCKAYKYLPRRQSRVRSQPDSPLKHKCMPEYEWVWRQHIKIVFRKIISRYTQRQN